MAVKNYNDIKFENTTYVDITKKWSKLKSLFQSKEARDIWEPCLREFTQIECKKRGKEYPVAFYEGENARPCWHDGDWRCGTSRPPEWWNYACGKACHWVADLALFVAQAGLKREQWRIVTSQKHSTVWNGDCENPVVFDLNFSALGIPPSEALLFAARRGRELKVGEYLKGHLHGTPV